MPDPDSISGDIIAAATFLAGLVLMYLGNLSTSYSSFTAEQQSDVRGTFRFRAWGAFVAFVLSVAVVALALASSWFDSSCLLAASAILLLIVFGGGVASALMLVLAIE